MEPPTSTCSHTLQLQNLNSVSMGNDDDVRYMPPQIYRAAAQGNTNIIGRKMHRADQYLTPKRNTILHIAAQFGQVNCVQWIIWNYREKYSFSLTLLVLLQWANLKGDSPLHLAAREGHLEVVQSLISAARDLISQRDIESGVEVDKAMLRMTNNENDTALHEAVRYHHPHVVKLLIQEDPDFTYGANFSGGTPLYMAAERGFADLVKIIIENTTLAPPAHTGPMGRTVLHAAVLCSDTKMVEEILGWNRDLTKEVDENGWSPLHFAAYLGYFPIVRQLLRKSDRSVIYLRVKNDDNKTALHIAATRGNVSTVRLLVSRYPDCCEQVDINGNNALHLLMMQRRLFSRWLKDIPWMNVGSLLNEKNVEGQTPLHLLVDSQRRIRPTYIRNKKVDKMALNNQNLTPMDKILLADDLFGRKGHIINRLKHAKARVGPLLWQKAMSEDKNKKSKEEGDEEKNGLDTSFLRKASDSRLLVAALVATVSFAAGFTLPGGYDDKNGMAMLSKTPGFRAFVVADSMALVLSVAAVLCHFHTSLTNNKKQVIFLLIWARWLTMLGVGAMVVAFLTNLYTVLPHHPGIVIFTFIFCVFSIFSISISTVPSTKKIVLS